MKKFIMINHGVGDPVNWEQYFAMLHEGGHMIGGSALDHGMALQNGAFMEARSASISGYIVFQAEDLESALAIMRQSPVHLSGGLVEMFPLV